MESGTPITLWRKTGSVIVSNKQLENERRAIVEVLSVSKVRNGGDRFSFRRAAPFKNLHNLDPTTRTCLVIVLCLERTPLKVKL